MNDYWALNPKTVKDWTPLRLPDVVLVTAALACYWGQIGLTNAFFQTSMHPDDIKKTAIKTPWGLFELSIYRRASAMRRRRIGLASTRLCGNLSAYVSRRLLMT
jgi:hypothetical protein